VRSRPHSRLVARLDTMSNAFWEVVSVGLNERVMLLRWGVECVFKSRNGRNWCLFSVLGGLQHTGTDWGGAQNERSRRQTGNYTRLPRA